MNRFKRWTSLLLFTATCSFAQLDDPFSVEARLEENIVRLEVGVPDRHYLYAENLKVTDALGNEQQAIELPDTVTITDPNTGKPKPVFNEPFTASFAWKPEPGGTGALHVKYWGCNDSVCFIPQTRVINLEAAAAAPVDEMPGSEQPVAAWKAELEYFENVKTGVGFMNAGNFLEFLDGSDTGDEAVAEIGVFRLFLNDPVAFVRESGLLLTILFILVGGLALNLTPCVLPMIPINLAIIGAGAQAGSRGRGFALGAAYGFGIAFAYGLLGVIVVLTGSQFGTIQSNPWFNLVICIIFIILALAMFDVFHIDFSRFQSKIGGGEQRRGRFPVALAMGAVMALLAGACVAPVVIAVLALSTNVYEANPAAGLMLPFVLGIGMALPWPFAGAGLSFLPKPGKWMEYVKYGFGIGIVLFALYYGHLSYRAFSTPKIAEANKEFAEKLEQARLEGKPVFIDFWASWCKNCKAMHNTTFKDEVVKARLAEYVFIKYAAEDFDDPDTQAVTQHFGVQGLPTYVVLQPK